MGLLFAPHIVEHCALKKTKRGKVEQVSTYDAPTAYKCHVQSMSGDAAFTATGVNMKRPHKVFLEPSEALNFKVGDKVIYDGEEYFVSQPVEIKKAMGGLFGGMTDHATMFMGDADGDEEGEA